MKAAGSWMNLDSETNLPRVGSQNQVIESIVKVKLTVVYTLADSL